MICTKWRWRSWHLHIGHSWNLTNGGHRGVLSLPCVQSIADEAHETHDDHCGARQGASWQEDGNQQQLIWHAETKRHWAHWEEQCPLWVRPSGEVGFSSDTSHITQYTLHNVTQHTACITQQTSHFTRHTTIQHTTMRGPISCNSSACLPWLELLAKVLPSVTHFCCAL